MCVCVSAPQSQLSDLPPTMLKNNFAAVPLAQTCVFLYPCFTIKKQTNTELREHTKPPASIPYFKPQKFIIIYFSISVFVIKMSCVGIFFFFVRTDDIVRRLLSLELASHVSSAPKRSHFYSFLVPVFSDELLP